MTLRDQQDDSNSALTREVPDTTPLEEEVIDWKKEVTKFSKQQLLSFMHLQFNFPEKSNLNKDTLIEEIWNKGERIQKEILLIKVLSDKLDQRLFRAYANSKGLSVTSGIHIRQIAIELYFLNPEFLYEGNALCWREQKRSYNEVIGKDVRNVKITKNLREELEKEFENETIKENKRLKVRGFSREGKAIRMTIYYETRVKRYLRFDDRKEVRSVFYKPINKLLAEYDAKSGVMRYSTGSSSRLGRILVEKIGKVIFGDEKFFRYTDVSITEPKNALKNPPPDPKTIILKDFRPDNFIITNLTISFDVETQPIFQIRSENVLETIKKYYYNLNFDEGKITSLTFYISFLDNKNNERRVTCEIETGKAPKVDDSYRDYFEQFLVKWGLRNEYHRTLTNKN